MATSYDIIKAAMKTTDDLIKTVHQTTAAQPTRPDQIMHSSALDWPLTHSEKKTQIFRLYNYDLRAADTEVERLRAAVESAAAVLRAIKPSKEIDDDDKDSSADENLSPVKPRARSEGALPKCVQACKPALCRTPRSDRPVKQRRKVSFGGQPEEEPLQVAFHPIMTDSEDEVEVDAKAGQIKESPGPKKRTTKRDSIKLQKERSTTTNTDRGDASDDDSSTELKKPITSTKASTECRIQADSAKVTIGSRIKGNLPWVICSLVLAMFIGQFALSSSPEQNPNPTVVTLFGDPSCWVSGFRPEHCCLGAGGNPDCWDGDHTYERCCMGRRRGEK